MPSRRHLGSFSPSVGVRLQESRNAYTSRSDDVSVLLKTPNILLLGFPGSDRHFDRGEPRADPVRHRQSRQDAGLRVPPPARPLVRRREARDDRHRHDRMADRRRHRAHRRHDPHGRSRRRRPLFRGRRADLERAASASTRWPASPTRRTRDDASSERGIDASAIGTIDGHGLELWLCMRARSTSSRCPSSPPRALRARPPARAPARAYREARGFHIAPQGPESSIANARTLSSLAGSPVITMDILSDAFVDASLYRDLAFLSHLTAFLPSEAEIERIWRPASIEAWLRTHAVAHECHMAAKLGAKGALLCDGRAARSSMSRRSPSASSRRPTGAGDGFCGGFLAGLVAAKPLSTSNSLRYTREALPLSLSPSSDLETATQDAAFHSSARAWESRLHSDRSRFDARAGNRLPAGHIVKRARYVPASHPGNA